MLDFTAFLIAVGPVAIFITKAVDFVRELDDDDSWWGGWWILMALAFGVVIALLTGYNFVALVGGLRPEVMEKLTGTTGEVLTGLAIGGTASFWHEHMDKTSAEAKVAEVTLGTASSV